MIPLLVGLLLSALCCGSSEVRESNALDEPPIVVYDDTTEAYYYNESYDYYHYEVFTHNDKDAQLVFDQDSGTLKCSSILLLSVVLPLMMTC